MGSGQAPHEQRPLDATRNALIRISARYPAEEMRAIDRLMRSSEVVQARKQASFVQHEKTAYAALHKRWPEQACQIWLSAVIAGNYL